MSATIVKKVTCAFGLKAPAILKLVLEHPQKRPYSGRLVGIATGVKEGVSQHGEWSSLLGSFQFTSNTGEVLRAVQAFGPDLVILPIVAALRGGQQSVNVAVDVYARPSEKSPVGWEYVCESAIEAEDTDPLSLLLSRARPAVHAIAAQTMLTGDVLENAPEKTTAKAKKA